MDIKDNAKWILLLLAWSAWNCQAQSEWDWHEPAIDTTSLGFPMRNEMACEEYPILLRCPGRDVIQIVSAEYGRANTFTCSALASQMKNTKCSLPEAKDIMVEKCNNKTQCKVEVSSENFADPCPGTHKYLTVKFNCVKFMFGCPGFLIGIGQQQAASVNVQPQAGTWTKDPLYNTDHVFFAPSGQILHEYSTWSEFVSGNPVSRYNLPSDMAQGNIVVHDRNLFYVKANSRSIVRYNLMTRFRTKETVLPGSSSFHGDITLSADENGLWVSYVKARGVFTLSRLREDNLNIVNTWTTNRRLSDSRHIFMICGVLYSVNSATGRVDYSYNTNLKSNQEKRGLHIPFDSSYRSSQSRRRSGGISFSSYNATALSYNPRDQLLYLWNANNANAVYFKLHFNGQDPAKAYTIKTTTSKMKTTTTRHQTTRTTRRPITTSPEPRTLPEIKQPDIFLPQVDHCPQTTRGNINWPKTNAAEAATMPCRDGTGASATWRCVREPSMREAAWHVAGPDLSNCITWVSDIEAKYTGGMIGRATAFEKLASELTKREGQMTGKSIQVASELIKKLLKDSTTPSKDEAERIVRSVATVSSKLLSSKEAWEKMTKKKQAEVANTLMSATESAGLLYADTVAFIPADIRDNEPLVVDGGEVLTEIEVREKSLHYMAAASLTSFPDEGACRGALNCGYDVISIPDSEIVSQDREGPSIVVFALYQSLGDYLSTEEEQDWGIDSRVISATFPPTKYPTRLKNPAKIVLQHKQPSSLKRRCVYWDYSQSTNSGNWSDAGCRLVDANKTHTTCECDHLTSFAVLVNHGGVAMESYHDETLDIITKVGIAISIVCLIACVLTFSCFRNLHSDRNTIHKHLCICLLAAEAIFLIGINQTEHKIACSVIAGLLHYFFLAAFLWMALEGFQLYVMLVEVFEGNSRWKWYYLTGYGIPAVIVGISAGVDHTGYGTEKVCWLQVDTGFIWSFVGPISVIILANLVFLAMTVYKMYVHTLAFTDSGKINSIKASVRGASVLLCLLGITWAFGILWISEEMAVLAYLFCVFNAFQGMFIFIFHCLLPRQVRQEYSRCFGRLPCCQKLNHDAYVSNSMSFSKPYTPGRFSANATNGGPQQTSLSRQSQLRRMWNETVAPKNPESSPITSEVTQNRDAARGTTCSRRVASHHPPTGATSDQRIRQEDDVFLPPEHEIEPRPESVRLLPNQHGEIEYDRLQYYRCPEHYTQSPPLHQDRYSPGHFHSGIPPPQRLHNQPSTMVPGHNHPRFDPAFHSQPRRSDLPNDLDFEPSHPQNTRHDAAHPYYWELDPPLGHHHVHQSSLEENVSSTKRDSGISMQHLPPNSMIHRLTNEMQRCDVHRSRDSPQSQPDQDGSGRVISSQPIRKHEDDSRQRFPGNQKRPVAFSEDEGQGSSFEDQENAKMYNQNGQRCAVHNSRGVSPADRREKAALRASDPRILTSLNSDSDDPIVTDCSGSSAGSSFGRQYRRWSNQEKLV